MVLIPNDMNLARELLYMDSTQRSIMVAMDDYMGGVATQALVIETAAKNKKPELTLAGNAVCAPSAYRGYITSIDGDVTFGDTNRYEILQKPSWLEYSIAGDSIHLWGNENAGTFNPNDLLIKALAVDSKNDSTVATFQVNLLKPLQVLSSLTDTATEDQPYMHLLQLNRPSDKPTFSFTHLPDWLQMDDQYRLLGVPKIQHLSDTLVHFFVSDSQCPVETEHALTIYVEHVNHAPVIATTHLPAAYERVSYNAQVRAFDIDSLIEDAGLQYTLIPSWSWLSVDAQTGMLSGKPLAQHASDTVFQVTVQDKQGGSDSKIFTLAIIGYKKPELTLTSNTACAQNEYKGYITPIDDNTYDYEILQKPSWIEYAITGDSIYLWGNENIGTLNPNDLLIKILAVNSKDVSDTVEFQVNFLEPLQILSPLKDTATEDKRYTHQIQLNRLPIEPTFSFPDLPGWLQMDDQYLLSGTPQIQNLSDTLVHFTVFDSQCPVEAEHTLAIHIEHVNHTPVIATTHLPAAYEGEVYNAQVRTFDVDSSIEDTGLQYALIPSWSWLNVNPQTGMLSGTPLAKHISDTAFQFTVQDRQGDSDSKIFNIKVVEKEKMLLNNKMLLGESFTCQIIWSATENLHYAKIQAERDVVFQYYIYDITGYLIYASPKQSLKSGAHYLPFDIGRQPMGIYIFVVVVNNTLRNSIQFVNYQ
jgi:hypothetical protein